VLWIIQALKTFLRGQRNRRRLPELALLVCLALTGGCKTPMPEPSWSQSETTALREQIMSLGGRVDAGEAGFLAATAIQHPLALAQQYRAVRPPWLHNMLVNSGHRERGLCYHWANDLFVQLKERPLHSLDLHLAVAHMDTRREHNAVIVTARGQPFATGLVLDGWRRSGRLWSGPVVTDKYPWQPLPHERVNPALQKLVAK
jgi:hypothetical protein